MKLTNKQLEYYRRNKKLVKIERAPELGSNNIYGFILDYSDKFILLAEENDFYIDGWLIINRFYIEAIKTTKNSNYCKKILQKEGLLDDIKPPFTINISSYNNVFRSLKKHKQIVIVEDEHPDGGVFLIGPIKKIDKGSVSIRHFTGYGEWIRARRYIKFEDISIVGLGNNYIRLCAKYIDTEL
ncbi:MAG: hypothetical protein WC765_07915 [Phycisphaerae bacterium]